MSKAGRVGVKTRDVNKRQGSEKAQRLLKLLRGRRQSR